VIVHRIDPVRDSRWREFLDRHPSASVFHTPNWLEALRRSYGYSSFVLTTSSPGDQLNNGLVCCDVNSWLTGRRLVSLPFSDHCEPLVDDRADLNAIISTLDLELHQKGLLYVEIRPVRDVEHGTSLHCSSHVYCLHELDLNADLETLFSNFHKDSTQRKIRRAEREQLTYEEGQSESLLDAFYRLLLMTRRRHGLPPQPLSWFQSLIDCFGEVLKIRVAFKGKLPVAAILTIRNKKILVYKYGCSDARFHSLGGIHLLFWRSIQEAKNDGLHVVDFGRSNLENTGLIKFKDRWGGKRSVLTYFRLSALDQSRGIFSPVGTGRGGKAAARVFSHLPDPILSLAGDLVYRHLG
jgi:CelD/BcsL family acetyltransferase involved in cellulose biosynthesis